MLLEIGDLGKSIGVVVSPIEVPHRTNTTCADVLGAHDVGGGRLVASVSDPDGNILGVLQDS